MEYVYSVLLLSETGTRIDESTIAAVLSAAGADPDRPRIRAMVAALNDVDLNEVRSRGIARADRGDGPGEPARTWTPPDASSHEDGETTREDGSTGDHWTTGDGGSTGDDGGS